MDAIQLCFLISIFFKQFYIFPSGGLQIGDIFLLVSFMLYMLKHIRGRTLKFNKIDNNLLLFVYIAIFINIFYYMIYNNKQFLLSSFYYVYNFMLVIMFRNLIKEDGFITSLLKVLKLNIYTQLVIFILGIGRYYADIRYMGTFNDPNQMAFFIYMTLMLIIITSHILNLKVNIVYYLITWFLVFETSSTGMLLAMTCFTVIYTVADKFRIKIKNILISTITILIIVLIVLPSVNKMQRVLLDIPIIQRLEEKVDKMFNESDSKNNERLKDKDSFIVDRRIDKLIIYPEKMLFGAGEGDYSRFDKTYSAGGEIHSTLPSIIFCYGIIPTIMILIWFIKNIWHVPLKINAIYISLIIQSFTLANQRQPYFWMIFVIGSIYSNKKKYRYCI